MFGSKILLIHYVFAWKMITGYLMFGYWYSEMLIKQKITVVFK